MNIADHTYGLHNDVVIEVAEPPKGPIYLEGYAIKRYEAAFKLLTEKIESLESKIDYIEKELFGSATKRKTLIAEIHDRIDRLVIRTGDLHNEIIDLKKDKEED